jgi:hypothetical protein
LPEPDEHQEEPVSEDKSFRDAAARVFDPEEVEGVLTSKFYTPKGLGTPANEADDGRRRDDKPAHYKVICISLYTDDLRRLDDMVDSLKARGLTKANRSALIRYALDRVDLDTVPRGL